MKIIVGVLSALLTFQVGLTIFAWRHGGAEFALTHAVAPFLIALVICAMPGIVLFMMDRQK